MIFSRLIAGRIPGAQLTLVETATGWRYSLWVTNLPAHLKFRSTTQTGSYARPATNQRE